MAGHWINVSPFSSWQQGHLLRLYKLTRSHAEEVNASTNLLANFIAAIPPQHVLSWRHFLIY